MADHPAPTLRTTDDGTEKHCARCDGWWPADREFFFGCAANPDGLSYMCKACDYERRARRGRPRRSPQPASAGA